jgi:large subunit ribosomal protein L25
MKGLELDVSKRDVTGKKVRFLRRQGLIPGNIYGHGIESTAVQTNSKDLKKLLAHAGQTDLISLKLSSAKAPTKVLLRDIQRNPRNNELLHVEFYQVRMTEKIKADVPVVLVGEAPVLKNIKGSSLLQLIDALHIEALPDDLPHNVEVDVSVLSEIDHAIHIKDIQLSKGVTLLSEEDHVVVKVAEARKVEEEVVEEVAAEAAEVEVVGKEKEAEGEEEAGEEE